MRASQIRVRGISCLLGLLLSAAALPAEAETLSLLWDPSPDANTAGYMVYIGTQPGSPTKVYDVGPNQSFEWNGAIDGQQYYFSVAAYSAGPVIGTRSTEITRYPNSAPRLNNPGTQSTTKGALVTLQLSGSDPEGSPLTYGASGLPPGLQLTPATGQITGSPSTVGTYTVTATVTDGALSDAESFTWSVVQQASDAVTTPPPSSPPPTTVVPTSGHNNPTTSPTGNLPPALSDPGPQTATSGSTGWLQLSGRDPEGAPLTYGASGLPPGLLLTPGTGRISGTVSRTGRFVVTATVTDGALSDVKTFTWTVLDPVGDPIAPVVVITLPTSGGTFTSSQPFITIGGTATDNGGVVSVNWSSDRGLSGTATGTQNWIASVPLVSGTNTISVAARDEAGNAASATIVVKTASKNHDKPAPGVHLRANDR